ncbi:radial spokehead-like protein [Paraphysoderma sedebokerense]|nr:radial spokehead-like protein [Paraphysoderma sedebokerense]
MATMSSQPAGLARASPEKNDQPKTSNYKPKSEDAEFKSARNYLLTKSAKTNTNLYDHLTDVIGKLLELRVGNPVDVFENISAEIKRQRFGLDSYDSPLGFKIAKPAQPSVPLAKEIGVLFKPNAEENDSDAAGELPDIVDLGNLFEWAGVSLGREETFILALHIAQLVRTKQLKSARLFGKIFGTKSNYIIVESECESEDDTDEIDKIEAATAGGVEMFAPFEGFEKAGTKAKVKTRVPKEDSGIGVNKYVYWVCNYAGGAWTRLPDITPEMIESARNIKKYFTGDLNKQVVSYPPFHGTEAHYLRAQIARIGASTVVSPAGYYTFDGEGGDENAAAPTSIIINPEFEGLPNEALLQLSNWVHHAPYVLPQGRTTWVDPSVKSDEEAEDEAVEEDNGDQNPIEDGESDQPIEAQSGPGLLTSIAEDNEHYGQSAWTVQLCSRFQNPKFSPVHLRSNRWPGAHSVFYNGKFANIYVGDGLKDLGDQGFAVPVIPTQRQEYPDLKEQLDPTVEEEKKFEEMMREKAEDKDESDGEGEEQD